MLVYILCYIILYYIKLWYIILYYYIAQLQFVSYLYFSNQKEFDLKSIDHEFLLFCKSLNKQFIQFISQFIQFISQFKRKNEKSSKVSKQQSFK